MTSVKAWLNATCGIPLEDMVRVWDRWEGGLYALLHARIGPSVLVASSGMSNLPGLRLLHAVGRQRAVRRMH